jgi:C4-dicarboxylate-binding protein DctP
MKKLLALFLATMMVLSLAACGQKEEKPSSAPTTGTATESADVIEITYGHGFNPGSPQALAADEFKARLEAESNGRFKVTVQGAGVLGSAQEMFESMQMGGQEIALLPTARISGFSPTLQIFDLPFLFPDKETAYEIFDGEVGAELLKTLDSTGVKGLAVYEDGFKHFTCSEKIETLEDFAGKKFRTMESPIIMEQFNSLKANPVPVDFAELYNALQQKTVEGQENPLATIVPMKFYEVQDYMLLSGHAYLAQMFLVSGAWFDALSAEDQELVTKIAKEVAVWEREVVAAEEENYLQTVADSGTTIIELSEAERAKMKEATASVYDVAKDIVGEDLLNLVVEAVNK